MDAAGYLLLAAVGGYVSWKSGDWVEAFGRAYRLRLWREYRQWRDALHRAQDRYDLNEGDRLCRIGPRGLAIETANGGKSDNS